MNYVSFENLAEILIRTGGGGGSGQSGSAISSWTANTDYTAGDFIEYNNVIYKVTQDFTSGSDFSTDNLESIIVSSLTDDERQAIVDAWGGSSSGSGGGGN